MIDDNEKEIAIRIADGIWYGEVEYFRDMVRITEKDIWTYIDESGIFPIGIADKVAPVVYYILRKRKKGLICPFCNKDMTPETVVETWKSNNGLLRRKDRTAHVFIVCPCCERIIADSLLDLERDGSYKYRMYTGRRKLEYRKPMLVKKRVE